MSLSVACLSCGAKLRAPDNAAGKSFKCPKCGKPVSVTAITQQPSKPQIEKVEPVSPFQTPHAPTVDRLEEVTVQAAQPSREESTKACPFCGETVLAVAKKCKHCGETIDVTLRAAEEAKRTAERRQQQVFMSAGGGGASSSSSAAADSSQKPPALLVNCVAMVITFILCAGLPLVICGGMLHGCNSALEKSTQRQDRPGPAKDQKGKPGAKEGGEKAAPP